MPPYRADAFDPETVRELQILLEEAWNSLSPERRLRTTKSALARRLIRRAAQGVSDPARLRAYAVIEIM